MIDVAVRADELDVALQQALRQERTKAPNCYGDGHAAERIVQLLATLPLDAHVLEKTNAY